MKTLILAAIRCPLMFTAVAALSIAYPASVQAVPTTYQYTGNPFTTAVAPYTTSDFVTAMVRLAGPLGANMPLTLVTPTAFNLTDGVQRITNHNATFFSMYFATDANAHITEWLVIVGNTSVAFIETLNFLELFDYGEHPRGPFSRFAYNRGNPGVWTTVTTNVPDTGSSLSLMTLTLMALGVVARRFQRGAG